MRHELNVEQNNQFLNRKLSAYAQEYNYSVIWFMFVFDVGMHFNFDCITANEVVLYYCDNEFYSLLNYGSSKNLSGIIWAWLLCHSIEMYYIWIVLP